MPNKRLRQCPTCFRFLDDDTRRNMGLRNGEVLNDLCPGRVGPSDFDHVLIGGQSHILHNGKISPQRVGILEYKDGGELGDGQRWLLNALRGNWRDLDDGRRLIVRYQVLPRLTHDPEARLRPIVEWLWTPRGSRAPRIILPDYLSGVAVQEAFL